MDFETHMHTARCAKKNGNRVELRFRNYTATKGYTVFATKLVYVLRIDRYRGAALVSRVGQFENAPAFWVFLEQLYPMDCTRK